MQYFPTDVDSITIPQTGHTHRREDGADRMAVDCAACDPYMARYGASPNLSSVRLTYDEQKQMEEERRMAEVVTRDFAKGFAQHAADMMRGLPS